MMSILVSLVLPRSRTRASLISVESWARTLLSSGLFVIAGYVSQLDLSNVWLMAALVMFIAAMATLATLYWHSAIVATVVTGVGLCAATYGWNCWLIAPVSATALKSHYQDELRYTVQRTTLELGDAHVRPQKISTPVSLVLTSSTHWSVLRISVGKGVIRTETCVADFKMVGDRYNGVYRFSLTSPANVILEAPESSSPDSYHAAIVEGHFLPLLIASITTLDWITAGVIVAAATCLFLFVVSTFLRNMRDELAVAEQLGKFRERMARRWQSQEVATVGHGTSSSLDPRSDPWCDIHTLLKSMDIVSLGVASTMPGFRTAIRQEGTFERKYRVVRQDDLDVPHRNSVAEAAPPPSLADESDDIIAMTDNQFASYLANPETSRLTTIDLQPFASLLPPTVGADSAAEVYAYPLLSRYGTRDGGLRGIAFFVQRSPFGITAHEHYTIEGIAQVLDRWELEFFRHTLLWHDEVARAEARLAEVIYQLRELDGYDLPNGEGHSASSPDFVDENDCLTLAWGTDRLPLIGALRMLYRLRMDQTRLYQEPSSTAYAWIRAVEFPEFISVCTRAAVAEYLARSDSLATTRQNHPFIQIKSTGQPSSLGDCHFPLVYVWQALENLLVNALVHAADGGSATDGHPIKCDVEIMWNAPGPELRIVIVSSRKGIPRDLWERYVVSGRVPAGNDRKGLWIAAHCAERAGGELQALNEPADYVTPCLVLKWAPPRRSSS